MENTSQTPELSPEDKASQMLAVQTARHQKLQRRLAYLETLLKAKSLEQENNLMATRILALELKLGLRKPPASSELGGKPQEEEPPPRETSHESENDDDDNDGFETVENPDESAETKYLSSKTHKKKQKAPTKRKSKKISVDL